MQHTIQTLKRLRRASTPPRSTHINPRWSRHLRTLAALSLPLWLSACALFGLGEELAGLSQDSMIGGRVHGEVHGEAPLYVAVYAQPGGPALHAYSSLRTAASERRFFFMLPPGDYRLLAFQDDDGDQRHSPGEAIGEISATQRQQLTEQTERYDIDIQLQRQPEALALLDLSSAKLELLRPSAPATAGAIVSMDHPSFSDEAAKLGLWHPRQYMNRVAGGLYFLEPYDADKTPVLLVHGALGHPGNWRELVATMDRERFQPWLYYYPTAVGLEDISTYLGLILYELHNRLGFERLTVVAHSMGGLVSLRTVQMLDEYWGTESPIEQLITLSTPWQGHKGAGLGAKLAPIAVPSWLDMSPDSTFLSRLAQRGVPTHIPHTLLFSYRGGSSLGDKADGAVPLTSQLHLDYQQRARRVTGFNQTHRSILSATRSLQAVHSALE